LYSNRSIERSAWEDDFWTPEPWFRNQPVFLLGGGPGLTPGIAALLPGRCCIAVNSSYLLAPRDALLFFTDNSWFEPRVDVVLSWAGPVVTQSRHSKRAVPTLRRIKSVAARNFPEPGSGVVMQGRSTGQTAIGLAAAMLGDPIILLGFDMRAVGGREHHHDDYQDPARRPAQPEVYEKHFLPAFRGWGEMAARAGLTVLNATPGSALKEFPMVDPETVL
jgi:hypothetical protein